MVGLHYEKSNGSMFLLCEAAYYVFTRKNAHSDYEISDMKEYSKIIGTLPMTQCLALKTSKIKKEEIYYFMQPSTILPVSFFNNEITQNGDGLFVYHEVLTDRKLWNCKTIGVHTIMACYIDMPMCYVFKSAHKYEVNDPGF